MKSHLLPGGLATVVATLTGCSTGGSPDLSSIGNGLTIIGLAIVLAALIRSIGSQWNKPPKDTSHEKPQ